MSTSQPRNNTVDAAAKAALVTVFDFLGDQRSAVTLIGGQAVAVRAALAQQQADYTRDADLSFDPTVVADEPLIHELMLKNGFTRGPNPGSWTKPHPTEADVPFHVEVDLMVGAGLLPASSSRAGVVRPHDKHTFRNTQGIEATVIDFDIVDLGVLPNVNRSLNVRVAGQAALIVAKCHKIGERLDTGDLRRVDAKDAGDVFRLMRSEPITTTTERFRTLLNNERSLAATLQGLAYLVSLFRREQTEGTNLAVTAMAGEIDAAVVRAFSSAWTDDLFDRLQDNLQFRAAAIRP